MSDRCWIRRRHFGRGGTFLNTSYGVRPKWYPKAVSFTATAHRRAQYHPLFAGAVIGCIQIRWGARRLGSRPSRRPTGRNAGRRPNWTGSNLRFEWRATGSTLLRGGGGSNTLTSPRRRSPVQQTPPPPIFSFLFFCSGVHCRFQAPLPPPGGPRMSSSSSDAAGRAQPPRLLDLVRQVARSRFGQDGPAERCAHWTLQFVLFHGRRHPRELTPGDVGRFLEHVAQTANGPAQHPGTSP